MTHTIHRQAAFGLFTEIIRHPLCWTKKNKTADLKLTPMWASPTIEEMVDSILIVGYIAFKIKDARVVIAVPATLDLLWNGSDWELSPTDAKEWTLVMHTAPARPVVSGPATYRTAAALAMVDTVRYDAMSANVLKRDRYNSRPAVFTMVDSKLKNANGASRQWFQQATSADAAAMRNLDVDTTFSSIIAKRADTVQRLAEQTALHRERIGHNVDNSGTGVPAPDGNMHHQEHIITDGKEIVASRPLLSLQDGNHVWNKLAFDIFFAFRVPPQVLGLNVNAERTSINPRLNEVVLNMFFFTVSRMRTIIEHVFAQLNVDGAVLTFVPMIGKADLDRLGFALKRKVAPGFYGNAYDIPADVIDPARLDLLGPDGNGAEAGPKKRKVVNRDDEGDGKLKE